MNVSFQVLIISALKLVLDLKIASIGINMRTNGAQFILSKPMYSPEYGIYKEWPASVTCCQVPRSSMSCKKELHKYQGRKPHFSNFFKIFFSW